MVATAAPLQHAPILMVCRVSEMYRAITLPTGLVGAQVSLAPSVGGSVVREGELPASLRQLVLLLLASFSLIVLILAGPVPAIFASGIDIPAAEQQWLELINADRAAYGLPPLAPDPRLMEIARWRSEDMVARNYFSHDIGGYTVFEILRQRQISYQVAGENLAVNTFDDSLTVAMAESGLMSSPRHRANILRPDFTAIGVGIATGPNRLTVFTQLFLKS
jgi:hypothetical protein